MKSRMLSRIVSGDENCRLSDRDFEEIIGKNENIVSKQLQDTKLGHREILRLTENLSYNLESLPGQCSHPCGSTVGDQLRENSQRLCCK